MSMQTFRGYPIISDQIDAEGLGIVWRELEKTLDANIEGDVVELGCYAGTTSIFIRRLLDEKVESSKRAFHAYDSFESLPEKSREDQNAAGVDFKKGELAVSKKQFMQTFQRANLAPPVTHKCWFDEIGGEDIPNQIAFAFLDSDFYDSILTSLKIVWPHMQAGGIVLIDDYKRETLPGVERAVHDFFQGKPNVKTLRAEHNIAIITT